MIRFVTLCFIGGWVLLGTTGLLGPVVAIGSWLAIIWGIIYLITKKK